MQRQVNIIVTALLLTILTLNLCLGGRDSTSHYVSSSGGGVSSGIRREKQPRDIRGFQQMSIARGFGKRGSLDREEVLHGFVTGDQLGNEQLDNARSKQFNSLESFTDKMSESFPVDWFVIAMQNNPLLARTVLHKFVDVNGDGMLSTDELLRPAVF